MKKIRKTFYKAAFVATGLVLPVASLTSCTPTWNTNHIISTFYNSFDMLTTLGITPYGQTRSDKGRNKNIFPYIEKYVDQSKTVFGDFTSSTSEPNMKALAEMQIDTLVTNEWDRPNEETYKNSGYISHLAYTSMADSKDSKYGEVASKFEWNTYKEGLFSYRKAFTMLADDLDKRFKPNPNTLEGQTAPFKSYRERADSVIEADKQVLADLRTQVQSKDQLKTWNIGIVSGQTGSGSREPIIELMAIHDPFIFPEMYGPETDSIGMGIKFPTPNKNNIGTDTLWFADEKGGGLASIKAKDYGVLTKAFENKFDKIIFVKSPDELYKGKDFDLNQQLDKLVPLLSSSKQNNGQSKAQTNIDVSDKVDTVYKTTSKDVVVVEWDDWYPTTWGVLGKTHVIKEMVKCFNLFLKQNDTTNANTNLITFPQDKSWKQYDKNQLVMPDKKA